MSCVEAQSKHFSILRFILLSFNTYHVDITASEDFETIENKLRRISDVEVSPIILLIVSLRSVLFPSISAERQ